MSVSVERISGADGSTYGVAQGVVHCQVNNQIEVTACGGIMEILCVNALLCVWRIVLSANRTVAQMSVGVERSSHTDDGMDGVAQGVVHRQIDNQVEETASCGVTKILSVNTLLCVRLIILSVNRTVAQMTVGVERISGAYCGTYGVAQGVVHCQIDNQIEETTVHRVTKMLNINALPGVLRIVLSAHGKVAEMSVGIERASGADGCTYGVVQSVVHLQFDNQIEKTAG